MKVRLITHTPDPERVIATAAKLCYSSSDIESLMEGLTPGKTEMFLNMLFSLGHESPIEHVSFTFAIEGISRACSLQLVRHRIASYSQKSQRYVNETQFEYVIPDAIASDEIVNDIYVDTMQMLQQRYDAIRAKLINNYVKDCMDEKAAEKKANEDARMVLPNACQTSIIVTMNVRSLFNFFKLRCCNRAQWEIRELAIEMYKLCENVAPDIFRHAGPSCAVTGKCSEGKMTCGKAEEVRDRFENIRLSNALDRVE